jgi:hypothetical protein
VSGKTSKSEKSEKSKQVIDIAIFSLILDFNLLISNEFLNGTICMKWPETPLTQSSFCEREGLSRFVFARHYRRSDKFAGTRRTPRSKKKDEKASAFRSVQHKATVMPDR